MAEHFDAIVIGAGIAGETCAHRLRMAGRHVALVERERLGGECAFWAAIPSATPLGPANLRWRADAAHYRSVPRIIFTDPQVAATGWTTMTREGRPLADIASVTVELKERPRRPLTARQEEAGQLSLYADTAREVLVGAWAVAAEASDWIELAVLAIRAEIPLNVLRDVLEQFPPFGEVYLSALDQLTSATMRG
jgi:pyruvate/2-oxoglutarate dehydrogenase complex dihydrolipoamide dehydrogenase (E3) component